MVGSVSVFGGGSDPSSTIGIGGGAGGFSKLLEFIEIAGK
jgi:hypothetical protein